MCSALGPAGVGLGAAMVAATLVGAAAPVGAVSEETATATTYATLTTYKVTSSEITNPVGGYNFYDRVDVHGNNAVDNVYIRWVKCGYTSTQDTPSSVGGQAKLSTANSPWQGALGTNFIKNTCARSWSRKLTTLGGSVSMPYEIYFDSAYRP